MSEPKLWIPETLAQYDELQKWLSATKDRSISHWEEAMRWYGRHDLFFLVNFIMSDGRIKHSTYGTPFHYHDFYLELCKKTQWQLDNCESSFDGSARRGGKSTIRTKAGTIQTILNYPNIAICVFSVERQLARKHLRSIKEELQGNKLLKVLYPEVLYDDPETAAKNGETVWSITDGIRVKRSIPRPNQTVECNTFFGGPTGSGYDFIHFDDCEDGSVVGTPDAITKLHDAFDDGISLATPVVLRKPIVWVTNTFYHPEGIAKKQFDRYRSDPRKVRVIPAEENAGTDGPGPMKGYPVYPFTTEVLKMKYDECSDKDEYAVQYLCDFGLGQSRALKPGWIKYYDEKPEEAMRDKNVYVCIDASRGIYDPMGIWVWAVGIDGRLYWVGGSRKKLDPASPAFADEIFLTVARCANFASQVVEIRVEQMNSQTWAELIGSELRKRGMNVPVIPCRGKLANERGLRKFETTKLEREWQRWSPALQRGDVFFPKPQSQGGYDIPTTDEKGIPFYLVDYFLEFEYGLFPRAPHDDLLDSGALIWDPEAPSIILPTLQYRSNRRANGHRGTSWMSA